MGRTAPLTSKHCILHIYSTNIGTEYFKHALYSPFLFSLKCSLFHNVCLVPILFTFYIQGVLKLKKNNSGAKGYESQSVAAATIPHRIGQCIYSVLFTFYIQGVLKLKKK